MLAQVITRGTVAGASGSFYAREQLEDYRGIAVGRRVPHQAQAEFARDMLLDSPGRDEIPWESHVHQLSLWPTA